MAVLFWLLFLLAAGPAANPQQDLTKRNGAVWQQLISQSG